MFENFLLNFQEDEIEAFKSVGGKDFFLPVEIRGLNVLASMCSGKSFRNGAYRFIDFNHEGEWRARIEAAFPSFRQRIVPFGYDWLGRFFCLDLQRKADDQPQVLLFSVFSDEVLEIPADIQQFHEDILLEQAEPALELMKFSEFQRHVSFKNMAHSDCAELLVPLYLGGQFDVDNMKIGDVALYWDLSASILSQSRQLAAGTKIGGVSMGTSH